MTAPDTSLRAAFACLDAGDAECAAIVAGVVDDVRDEVTAFRFAARLYLTCADNRYADAVVGDLELAARALCGAVTAARLRAAAVAAPDRRSRPSLLRRIVDHWSATPHARLGRLALPTDDPASQDSAEVAAAAELEVHYGLRREVGDPVDVYTSDYLDELERRVNRSVLRLRPARRLGTLADAGGVDDDV